MCPFNLNPFSIRWVFARWVYPMPGKGHIATSSQHHHTWYFALHTSIFHTDLTKCWFGKIGSSLFQLSGNFGWFSVIFLGGIHRIHQRWTHWVFCQEFMATWRLRGGWKTDRLQKPKWDGSWFRRGSVSGIQKITRRSWWLGRGASQPIHWIQHWIWWIQNIKYPAIHWFGSNKRCH